MKAETSEERFARLSALAAENGTSWDVEAAKELSPLAQGADWRRLASERLEAMGYEFRARGVGGEAPPSSPGLLAASDARERALRAMLAGGQMAREVENAEFAASMDALKDEPGNNSE